MATAAMAMVITVRFIEKLVDFRRDDPFLALPMVNFSSLHDD
jgi:hypothetical protein